MIVAFLYLDVDYFKVIPHYSKRFVLNNSFVAWANVPHFAIYQTENIFWRYGRTDSIALMRVFPKAIVLTTKSHFHVKRTYASIRGLGLVYTSPG